MKAPKPQNLINQCFNSKKLEFVWQFPREDGLKEQFILQVHLNPMVYMEWGTVNNAGDYIEPAQSHKFGYGHLNPEAFLIYEANWAPKKFPSIYKNFTNGQDLVSLVEDSVKYLQSI